jgi:hypothetical protein
MSLNALSNAQRRQLEKEQERKRKEAKRLAKRYLQAERAAKAALNDLDAVSAVGTPVVPPAVEIAMSPARK